MSQKRTDDKTKAGWPLTARQKRQKVSGRAQRKKDRHKNMTWRVVKKASKK